MPLYLDDFEPVGLPDTHVLALVAMAAAVGDEPVNPASAMRLLRTFVRPLLPQEQWPLLDIEGQPSWERVHILYPKLVFESKRGEDARLLAAATLIDILVRHTTRPRRDFTFPAFVELSSFTRMAGYLRLPVATPVAVIAGADIDLYNFCKYCWLPAESHGVCQFHSTRRLPIAPSAMLPACASATLKQAQRLRNEFEARVLALASREELEFHDSGFDAPVLVPPSGLRAWLLQWRPWLARAVQLHADSQRPNALQDLTVALYGPWAPQVIATIGAAVHLLTPITTRAEGWLAAREHRPKWGGARARRAAS